MTVLDPALIRIDKARLHNAHFRDAPRLASALDQLTPLSIGVGARATLIVRRLASRTALSRHGPADRFIAGLRDDLRARLVSAQRGGMDKDNDLYFEDDVALETAIVAAWLDGGPEPPWIRAIGAANPLTRWRRHILADLQLLPRIIARLVERGIAERWLVQFEATEIRAVTARLLEICGAAGPVNGQKLANNSARVDDRAVNTVAFGPKKRQITEFFLSEARSINRPELRLLVAVALIIIRRPTMITTPAFGEALASLIHAPQAALIPPQPSSTLSSPPQKRRPIVWEGTSGVPEPIRHERMPTTVAIAEPDRHRSAGQSPIATAGTASPSPVDRPVISTDFGGLFFLLNAFIALGLYGDFTRPGDGLKGLSPFELMYLLGARWFGARFKADPVAPRLLTFAGLRPGENPGQSFEPPNWSVPNYWLRPWPGAKGHDFPLTDRADLTPQRWTNNLARYLKARLQQSLSDRDAVAITCAQPGQIMLDRDRIIVRFPLAEHPIALRFAGLDRDPGWIPAAAHFIEFKFA